MDDVDVTINFQLSNPEHYGARFEIAERLRELLTVAIEDRELSVDGVEICDFDVIVDE